MEARTNLGALSENEDGDRTWEGVDTHRLPLPVVNEPCVHTAVSVGRSQGPKKLVPSGQMAAQPLFTQESQGMARSQQSLSLEKAGVGLGTAG